MADQRDHLAYMVAELTPLASNPKRRYAIDEPLRFSGYHRNAVIGSRRDQRDQFQPILLAIREKVDARTLVSYSTNTLKSKSF